MNDLQLFIFMWMKSVLTALKVKPGSQSLEKGLSCIFQALGNIPLNQGTEPAWQSTSNRAQKLELRE